MTNYQQKRNGYINSGQPFQAIQVSPEQEFPMLPLDSEARKICPCHSLRAGSDMKPGTILYSTCAPCSFLDW